MPGHAKTATPTVVHGINVDELFALIHRVRADPAKGKTQWRVSTTWQGQTRSRAEVEGFGIGGAEGCRPAARGIEPARAAQHAERREGPAGDGHDDARDAHAFGQGAGVQAAGTAEAHERELGRVMAALLGDGADGAGHLLFGQRQHALGQRLGAEIQRLGHGGHGALRRLGVQGQIPAQAGIGRQAAEQEVGVGDGGARTAAAVAGRARQGAGRIGAGPQAGCRRPPGPRRRPSAPARGSRAAGRP